MSRSVIRRCRSCQGSVKSFATKIFNYFIQPRAFFIRSSCAEPTRTLYKNLLRCASVTPVETHVSLETIANRIAFTSKVFVIEERSKEEIIVVPAWNARHSDTARFLPIVSFLCARTKRRSGFTSGTVIASPLLPKRMCRRSTRCDETRDLSRQRVSEIADKIDVNSHLARCSRRTLLPGGFPHGLTRCYTFSLALFLHNLPFS